MKDYSFLKRTGLFFVCCFLAMNVFGQSSQVINPSGGESPLLDDGLKVVVNTNGYLSVYRDSMAQYCCGLKYPSGVGSGVRFILRFSQGGVNNSTSLTFDACATTTAVQNGNDWTTSITGRVTSPISGHPFYITMNFHYTHPNKYFYVDYWVRAPYDMAYTTAETVHLYLTHDSYILGKDGSRGCRIVNGTGEFVGDYRNLSDNGTCGGGQNNPRYPSHHGFKTGGSFRSYYSAAHSSQYTIDANTNMLLNTIGTTCVDDGVAVEFTVGPLNRGEVGVRRIMHGYGDTLGEFNNVPVIDPIVIPGSSAPVTVNFTSSSYSETEGNSSHPASTIQITVSGGMLAQEQVCLFTASGGTATQNTHYSYAKGFTIPAGNYTTPQTFTLNNIIIMGDTLCHTANRTFNLTIDADACNDLIGRGANYTAAVTIIGDDPVPTVNQPLSDTVCPGMPVSAAKWEFTGTVPGTTYNWSATNATAIGLPSTSQTGVTTMPAFTALNATTSPIVSTVTVTPVQGTCSGSTKTFTITASLLTSITTQPSTAVPSGKLSNSGDFPTLSVAARGTSLAYQWYRNVTASTSGAILISGATSATYSPVTTLSPGDYYYYCIVTGDCGTATSTVSGKHTIFAALNNFTACRGDSLTFTAVYTNGGTPTFQWKKNGIIIPGATNSTYRYNPASGDTVTCEMTSTLTCAHPMVITSGTVVTHYPIPVMTFAASAICVGTTTQLSTTETGTWHAVNPSVASVTSGGLITGLSLGNAKFVFTNSLTGCKDTTTILAVGSFPIVNPITAPDNNVCISSTITLTTTTTGGVWTLSNNNAQIMGLNTNNTVSIQGVSEGQVYATYTVGTAPCQSSATFLLRILPATPPKIVIGLEK